MNDARAEEAIKANCGSMLLRMCGNGDTLKDLDTQAQPLVIAVPDFFNREDMETLLNTMASVFVLLYLLSM